MQVKIVNPKNGKLLYRFEDSLVDESGESFPIIYNVPRISELDNYSNNFGVQWNIFDKTQLDRESEGLDISQARFFAETHWGLEDLQGKNILEVGSGAGRFSKVVLEKTKGTLYSVDYSDSVTANYRNNGSIAPDRFNLFQASIYEMPFPNESFEKIFCFGVLQHTPNFEESIKSLISKAMLGGEIVVDFYPINGWWTKISAKYILRPILKKLSHARLLRLIESNIDWMIVASQFLHKIGLDILTRFLPVVDLRTLSGLRLDSKQLREWVVLDTYDMFSPIHDHPQRIADVVAMFERYGARVTFAGFEEFDTGARAAVVRGVRQSVFAI